MTEKTLFEYSFLTFVIGALISLLFGFKYKKTSIYASAMFSILASSLSLFASLESLANKTNLNFSYNLGFPIGNFEILIDPLSSFFILLISLLSIPVSIYSICYLKGEYLEKNISLITCLYQLFILSMILVVSSSNGFQFLILWELMTLISFGFVIFEYKNKENQDAGFIYLLMTHIGATFLLFTFLILIIFWNRKHNSIMVKKSFICFYNNWFWYKSWNYTASHLAAKSTSGSTKSYFCTYVRSND